LIDIERGTRELIRNPSVTEAALPTPGVAQLHEELPQPPHAPRS
jgi:hypothetical protein